MNKSDIDYSDIPPMTKNERDTLQQYYKDFGALPEVKK
jgi:hypothetical protein